jgi:ADP-heptose:LPS heptosyltransferase
MRARPVKKILIIRFRRVGDAVISSVLCSSLKKSFPGSEIHYVLNQAIAPLFENHPDIDKLITFSDAEQKSFTTYVLKIVKIVVEGKYDLIIDTRSTVKTLWFSLFSLNTPIRIGRKKIYNMIIQNYRIPLAGLDEVSNTLKLLHPLRRKFEIQEVRDFRLYVSDEERCAFSKKMADCGIDFNKPIIVCAVTARLEHKVWAKEKMVEALGRILSEYPTAQLVFNYSGEREKVNAEAISRTLGSHPRIFIDLEACNLRELLALFSFSSFFFGNEGGPRHISQAMDIPSFAIFPPKTPKLQWLPNSSERFQGIELAEINSAAAQNDSLSFEQKFDLIDTESVWKGLNQMLQKHLE